jgi:DNA-binding transcriptional LysR family regulator
MVNDPYQGRALKLRHFRVLETLNAARSMRVAARQLGVTTAAVSKSCLEIEDILGQTLFQRKGGQLIPALGVKRIIAAGQRINAELRSLHADLVNGQDELRGTVRIGFQAPVLQAALPGWITKIKTRHPYLTVALRYGMRPHLLADLEAQHIELALCSLMDVKGDPRFRSHVLGMDRHVVATGRGELELSEVLGRWEEFVDELWLLPERGMAMRDQFESALGLRGLRMPERLIEFSAPVLGLEIIEQCGAIGLMPLSMLHSEKPRDVSPVDAEGMWLDLGVVWPRDVPLSPVTQAVLDCIVEDGATP